MIDNLLAAESDAFESDFWIQKDNIFVEGDYLLESALIENIAQTCAAGFGYQDSLSGGTPKVGFIGAVSKLQVFALPKVATRINTKVVITHQLGSIFLAKGENFQDGKLLLECEVKIVVS
jgi:hypothetical protein